MDSSSPKSMHELDVAREAEIRDEFGSGDSSPASPYQYMPTSPTYSPSLLRRDSQSSSSSSHVAVVPIAKVRCVIDLTMDDEEGVAVAGGGAKFSFPLIVLVSR